MLGFINYNVKNFSGNMRISKGSSVVLKANKHSRIYIHFWKRNLHWNYSFCIAIKWQDWIVAYICDKRLLELSKRGLLYGDKVQKFDLCEYFIISKQRKVKVPLAKHTMKGILEYVYLGPASTSHLDITIYFIFYRWLQ